MTSRLKSAYIYIQSERCKGCRFCMPVCPKGVIGSASRINQAGYTPAVVIEEKANECTGCTACAIMCPDVAISIYRRNMAPSKPVS